ncbi:MAG: MOSC domain-containing protein [Archangium gephyra]|uniref:MOSC domain-containing protein n=1 Tax=Archangium gephyra TaxID=48 RepID=A0A2W5SV86_9BACT|nr:MAG: MOSC domain-containing protein [Archangium gephyra]
MAGMVVVGLGIADVPGSFETRAIEQAVLSFAGLEGDRHAGLTMKAGPRQKYLPKGAEVRNSRQLSIVSVEELAEIAASLGVKRVRASSLGANLLISGAPQLTKIAPGTRLVFPSGAVLVIDGENEPCVKSGRAIALAAEQPELAARFVKAAWHRRGLVAWVERPGLLRVGDPVTLVSR